MQPDAIVRDVLREARGLLGTRFRRNGRSPQFGLDCVGLVACALGEEAKHLLATTAPEEPSVQRQMLYNALRALDWTQTSKSGAGYVGEFAVGGHLHLGVLTEVGVIHAHAGLRRVVEGSIPDHWEHERTWKPARGV